MLASFRSTVAIIDREDVVAAFEKLATQTQARDDCDRITALQRAIDENPEAYDAYSRAMR